jgi:hypothetical protein
LTYLFILMAVAAAGLTRLWLVDRARRRSRYVDVDSYKQTLERITSGSSIAPARSRGKGRHSMGRSTDARERSRSGASVETLDPARREAARRRIEARRRTRVS